VRTIFRQLIDLSSRNDRRRFFVIAVSVLASNVLETLAVISILPFMWVVSDPTLAFEGSLGRLHAVLGSPERSEFLLTLGGAVLIIVLVANVVSAIVNWQLQRFAWGRFHQLSRRVLLHYLRQPYPFFLGRNSTELSKNVLSEVETAMTGVVIPLLHAWARVGLVTFVLSMLVIVDAQVALVSAFVIGAGYGGVYLLVRNRVSSYGEARLEANEARFTAAAEALSGVKAVKILGAEEAFLERFSRPSEVFSQATATREVLAVVPRYALEAVGFGGMIILIMLVLVRPGGPEGVLPLVALYGFAGLKLMPALQQVFASVTTTKFFAPALDRIHSELMGDAGSAQMREPTSDFDPDPDAPVVALSNLSFTYPGVEGPAVDNVSVEISRGQLHAFVGATGSGKTTVMDLILGLLEPSKGELRLMGQLSHSVDGTAWRRRIGYVPQETFLLDASLSANIAFGLEAADRNPEMVEEVVRIAQLADVVRELSDGLESVVGDRGSRLSGGQRQRIGIARALYGSPEVLVIDEGTSALDPSTEATLMKALGALDLTVLWVTHRLQTVRDFDQILVFEKGRLVGTGSHDHLMESCPPYKSQVLGS
jgi:ATP-binding cassette, subfamily B, bacterial PglK